MKKETNLLALLDDTVPEILPARIEMFYSIPHSFLDGLLRPGLDLILERELDSKNTGHLRVQSSQIAQKRQSHFKWIHRMRRPNMHKVRPR